MDLMDLMDFIAQSIVVIVFIIFIVNIIRRYMRNRKNLKQNYYAQISETNQRYGTQFNPDDCLGYINTFCLLFDPTAQKICIISKGDKVSIEDFSYVRAWELKWTEHPGSVFRYRNVRMVIHTNDFQDPMLIVSLHSKDSGDVWNSRLGVLFA